MINMSKKKRYVLLYEDSNEYYIRDNEEKYKDEGDFNWMTKNTILQALNEQNDLIEQLRYENMMQSTKLTEILWKYEHLLNDDFKNELFSKLNIRL